MDEIEGLVSICIPFFNSELFLSEAVESVLAQTYSDWELFLVDDGSTDRSTEIARAFAAQSTDRIHLLEHPEHRNCGLTCSRNLGIRHSSGQYLAFLDSDDVWLPNKLEHQVSRMKAHPEAGLAYGPSEYWYDWDVKGAEPQKNHIPPLAPGPKLYFPTALLTSSYPLGKYGAPCPSSFMLRRTAFDCVGGFNECFNPETHQLFEDMAFLAAVYLKVPVFVDDASLERYRRSSASMWHRAGGTTQEESARRYYFRWLREYLHQSGIVDPEIWRAVRRQGWMYWLPLPPSLTTLLRRIENRLSQ